MLKLCVQKFIALIIGAALLVGLSACAPLIPDNYLRSSSINSPQKINGQWLQPRLIPISAQMLESPEGRTLLEPALHPQPYRIGSYDTLNIIVWGHPEISTIPTTPLQNPSSESTMSVPFSTQNPTILVQTDGNIFYPYVGHLKVEGLTITETQDRITERLVKYIRNPQVSVQVAKYRYRNVFVLGEVKAPGLQPLTDKPLTLLEAISAAGGINAETADPTHVYLVRGSFQKPDIFWLNASSPQALIMASKFSLEENDIVYVSGATLNPWNRFINQVLPSFTAYFIARDITK